MENRILKTVSLLGVVGLMLSGCIEISTTATVNRDGTATGSITYESQASNLDALLEYNSNFAGDFGYRYGVTDVNYASISNCEVSEIVFTLDELAPMATNVSFRYVPSDQKSSLFVIGEVSAGSPNTLRLDHAVVIPASGVISDCENLADVETGELLTFTDDAIGNWNFGTISDVRQTRSEGFDFAPGLFIEQLANLPLEDRPAYFLLLEMMLAANSDEIETSSTPEFKACGTYVNNKKLNTLSFENQSPGEFESLIDSFKNIKIIHTDEVFSVTCLFENLSLEFLDRNVNENPDVASSPQEEGSWENVNQDLIWHFEMDANQGLSYDEAASDENINLVGLSAGQELFGDSSVAFQQLSTSQMSNSWKITGVLIGTNGTIHGNRVTFVNCQWYYSEIDNAYYYLEGFEPQNYVMDTVIGDSVLFKSNSVKILTKTPILTNIANRVKKTHVEVKKLIKLIGIYDGSITNPIKALANEKLVSKRVHALKSFLKKQGVKGTYKFRFVSDDDPSGDSKAKDKVVIQVTNGK